MGSSAVAGTLLLTGAGVFFLLGFGALLVDRGLAASGSGTLEQRFRVIAAHSAGYQWISFVLAVSFLLTGVGLGLLTLRQVRLGGGEWAFAAAVLYGVAATVMVVTMALNATLVVSGARQTAADGAVPEDAKAWWSAVEALVSWFMVLAFAAIVVVGIGFLREGPVSPWVGWASIALGGFLLVTFPLKFVMEFWIADLPLWVHVWGIMAGIALLRA